MKISSENMPKYRWSNKINEQTPPSMRERVTPEFKCLRMLLSGNLFETFHVCYCYKSAKEFLQQLWIECEFIGQQMRTEFTHGIVMYSSYVSEHQTVRRRKREVGRRTVVQEERSPHS